MNFSWVPIFTDDFQNLSIMSIGFLLQSRNDAVIWRGPKKTGAVILVKDIVIFPEQKRPNVKRLSIILL